VTGPSAVYTQLVVRPGATASASDLESGGVSVRMGETFREVSIIGALPDVLRLLLDASEAVIALVGGVGEAGAA
jgi:hypothetical protein